MNTQDRGQEFLHQVSEIKSELPISPRLIQRLFSQAREDSIASMEDISRTISEDQGLTARILKRVNSAYYGLQAQVSTVSRAVSILGFTQIRDIVLSIGLKTVTQKIDLKLIDLLQYWHHQSSTALLARNIAREAGYEEPDDLFTIGILHDLGKLITVIYNKDAWIQINNLARKEDLPLHVAEDKFWGIDHALIGGMLLQQWNLPDWVTEPVNWHHAPEMASSRHRFASRIIHVANSLNHFMNNESGQKIDPQLERLALERVKAEDIAARTLDDPAITYLKQLFI
ncbi:MAG: HDOD domain-containing protein [Thermodesulfobacteriota bacterium]